MAKIWTSKSKTNVAVIDLDKASNNKIDLTTGEGRKLNLRDASLGNDTIIKANKYARGAKELLVDGPIDQRTTKKTYDPQTKMKDKTYP